MFADMDICLECNCKIERSGNLAPEPIKDDHGEMALINYPDTTSVVSIGLSGEAGDRYDEDRGICASKLRSDGFLFSEFIVEFERFLGEFIVDRKVNIK